VLQPVDELAPRAPDGIRRRLPGVLEKLHPEDRIHPQRSQNQQVCDDERRRADHQQRQDGDEPIGQPVLADRAPRADDNTDHGAQHRADHH
jgi:hypothetical protein